MQIIKIMFLKPLDQQIKYNKHSQTIEWNGLRDLRVVAQLKNIDKATKILSIE